MSYNQPSFNYNLCVEFENSLSLKQEKKNINFIEDLKNDYDTFNQLNSEICKSMENDMLKDFNKKDQIVISKCIDSKLEIPINTLEFIKLWQSCIDEISINSNIFDSSSQRSKFNTSSLLLKEGESNFSLKNKNTTSEELEQKIIFLSSNKKDGQKQDLEFISKSYEEKYNQVLKQLDKDDKFFALSFFKACQNEIVCMLNAIKMSMQVR